MPIVYVHGVDTRLDKAYSTDVAVRRKFFTEFLAPLTIEGEAFGGCLDEKTSFPYWGDLGATFHWNMASLPQRPAKGSLGADEQLPFNDAPDLEEALATWRVVSPATMNLNQPLVRLARECDLRAAVLVLSSSMLEAAEDPETAAEFIVAASRYVETTPHPKWLTEDLKTDSAFLDRLIEHVLPSTSDGKSLGAFSAVHDVVTKAAGRAASAARDFAGAAAGRAGGLVSEKLLASRRSGMNAKLGRFFGDVFCYLANRAKPLTDPASIPGRISSAFDGAKKAGGKLLVIAHSLGAVITFDILSSWRRDLVVDLFVSVGSQVSHFEELKLYRSSDPRIPNGQAPLAARPPNIRRWINVYDRVDVFSYACERVFEAVRDIEYDSGTHIVNAHSAYFHQARFYQQLSDFVRTLT